MTPSPEPQAVDYSGRPLHAGDTVAYITHDPIGLAQGQICVLSPRDICIETGPHLVTFSGIPASLATPPPRPIDGTVKRNENGQEPLCYPQVALQDAYRTEHAEVRVVIGDREVSGQVSSEINSAIRRVRRGDGA